MTSSDAETGSKPIIIVSAADHPWRLDAYKMRFDSARWFSHSAPLPLPLRGRSFLLMCQTRGVPRPAPSITWYRDGEKVVNGKQFYIIVRELNL